MTVQSVQFSHSIVTNSLWPHGLQHTRPPCLSPSPRVCSNSCPSSHDAIQPSHPLLPPSSLALSLSQHQGLLQWVGSSHRVTKVLELQLQHQSFQWIFRTDFFYDWLGLISLQPKGLSRIFSSITVQKHQFFSAQPSLWSKSHIQTWLLEKP